ncbi:MAG: formylglycine-generating enzyme family protein [bacterium]|nr:formylglycine-generating enzyme family protein [bacterium]
MNMMVKSIAIYNGVVLRLIQVPSGSFMMGSEVDEESPVHEVSVGSFYIGKYQVTQQQYDIIMERRPVRTGNYPVDRVSWTDAVRFCKVLSSFSDIDFRLPSESEWEYACRAGTVNHADSEYQLGDCAWYAENSVSHSHPVGQLKPNAWGLCDMLGNVWEWCADAWHDNYEGAPVDGSTWKGEGTASRLLRGGSWVDDPPIVRSAVRLRDVAVFRDDSIGFRVVASSL